MPFEQVVEIAAGVGALIGIAGAESDNIANEVSTNGGRRATEQFNQVGPRLAKLAQQGLNPAACCFALVLVVGAQLAEEFDKALPLALAEPPHNGMIFYHFITPDSAVSDGTCDCSNRL